MGFGVENNMNLPQLPQNISNNGQEIWDWAISMGKEMARQHKITELQKQISGIGNHCGDCYKWMHSGECPREKRVKGRRVGPSCNEYICNQYIEKESSSEWREELKQKLKILENSK